MEYISLSFLSPPLFNCSNILVESNTTSTCVAAAEYCVSRGESPAVHTPGHVKNPIWPGSNDISTISGCWAKYFFFLCLTGDCGTLISASFQHFEWRQLIILNSPSWCQLSQVQIKKKRVQVNKTIGTLRLSIRLTPVKFYDDHNKYLVKCSRPAYPAVALTLERLRK